MRVPNRAVWLALAALMLVASVEILHDGRGTSFFEDEWDWVQWRRDWNADAFLQPHVQHLVAVPVLVFKLLFATVGLDSYAPYRVAALLAHLVVCLLVFLIARRYVSPWLAVAATTLVLFLGAGWQDVLWAVNLDRTIATACGLAIVLLIDRRGRGAEIAIAVLLTVSLASASVGIAVWVGVAAALVAKRPFIRRRLWILAVPAVLYGLWYLKYGVSPPHHDFSSIPNYSADAAAAATGALVGLDIDWGRILVALLVIAVLRRLVVAERIAARTAMVLAVPLSFWALTAIARAYLNEPAASRYVYVGGAWVLVLAVVVLAPRVTSRRVAVLVAMVTALAVVANTGTFRAGGDERRADVTLELAKLGAVEVARDHVPPAFVPEPRHAPTLTAAGYFAAIDDLGSPAPSPTQLAAAPERERLAADTTLIAAEGITAAEPQGGGSGRSCAVGTQVDLDVPSSGLVISGPASVSLRRFAAGFQPPLKTTGLALVRPPRDRYAGPWHARVAAVEPVNVCFAGG
jgi:hypothetical protein